MANKELMKNDVYLSFGEMFNRAYDLNSYADLFAGVYSLRQVAERRYDRMFNDFDSKEDTKKSLYDALAFIQYIDSKFGGKSLLIKSGLKGYHVYTFFPEVDLLNFSNVMRTFIGEIKEELDLGTLDKSVIAQPTRVSRIPYFKHIAGKSMCLPFNLTKNKVGLDLLDFEISSLHTELLRRDKEIETHKSNIPEYKLHQPVRPNRTKRYDAELNYLFRIMSKLPKGSNTGWNRAIWMLIAPRLVRTYDLETARQVMIQFLEQTGQTQARAYCIAQVNNAERKKNYTPMNLNTFLKKFPEVKKYWLK